MRIRLDVRRHSLPSAKILWTTDGLRPGAAGPSRHASVAQLLQQVSEVVPLEVGGAGLEDYVVEVHGYECLHFCNLDQILQEDDEVTIRPLEFTDVRSRRLSGRHQISGDGRHLIDGVAFGRPFLRPGPLAGVLHGDNEDEVDLEQLLLDGPGRLEDEFEEPDDLEDDEFLEESNEPNLANELEGLAEETRLVAHRTASMPTASNSAPSDIQRSLKRKRSEGLGIGGVGLSTLLHSEQSPVGSLRVSKRRRSSTNGAPASSNLSVRFAESEQETPATIRISGDSAEESDDEDFEPESGASTVSDKENRDPARSAMRNSISKSSSSSSSDTSSSGSSSSSSSGSSSSSSSGSSSESGSDSDSSEASSGSSTNGRPDYGYYKSSEGSNGSSDSSNSGDSSSSEQSSASGSNRLGTAGHQSKVKQAPPGAGSNATTRRNHRRRDLQRLLQLKDAGILHADAGLSECRAWYAHFTPGDAKRVVQSAIEAKRENLLKTIVSGGIETTDEQNSFSALVPHESKSISAKPAVTDDSWRDNVILRAVECCGRPRRLKTPPFPFVQRWHQKRSGKKSRNSDFLLQFPHEGHYDYVELDYGDDPVVADGTTQHLVPEDVSQETDDLPVPPEDISSLTPLVATSTVPGAVIVFKRMEMSKATNWSPVISDYQTAKIKSIDNDTLLLDLAKRDHSMAQAKEFDPLSGQRVYSGFEAPDGDEEVDGDPGRLELDLAELIDPRLLSPANGPTVPNSGDDKSPGVNATLGPNEPLEDRSAGVQDAGPSTTSAAPDANRQHTPSKETPSSQSSPLNSTLRRSARTRTPSKRIQDDQPHAAGSPESSRQTSPVKGAHVHSQPGDSQNKAVKSEADPDDGGSVASNSISLSPQHQRSEPSAATRKSPRLTRSLRSSSRTLSRLES